MNNKLIQDLESLIDINNQEYKDQHKKSNQDFFNYCDINSANNWQHPEKPPTQTSMVLACKLLKPNRILDFGSGLTGYTFRNYFSESETISIDDSFFWASRLSWYLRKSGVDSKGLYWYDGLNFCDLHTVIEENLIDDLMNNPKIINKKFLDVKSGEIFIDEAKLFKCPTVSYLFCDTRKYGEFLPTDPKWNDPSYRLNSYSVKRTSYYPLGNDPSAIFDDSIYSIGGGKKKKADELGKFNFIHYDFGGMYTRASYLNLALDMLDRSDDSLMYIDDLHKEDVFWQNKSFKDIANDYVLSHGGVWLNCSEALIDFQGGYGGIAYFPPK